MDHLKEIGVEESNSDAISDLKRNLAVKNNRLRNTQKPVADKCY
jgi:hypothetical protein